MQLFDALNLDAFEDGGAVAMSDSQGQVSREELLARLAGLARHIDPKARVVGIFAQNGIDWAVAQLGCALAGKIVVPLPTFFSAAQLGHIVRDASVDLILASGATLPRAQSAGVATRLIGSYEPHRRLPDIRDGFGQVIYTSGSTGQPKGVRHFSGQIAWSTAALATATGATARDSYLSVLPLPLLLETICAVFVPVLLGARVHFETELAEAVGLGSAAGLTRAVAVHQPTMCVLVPQLLKAWTADMLSSGERPPASLRYVAVGGAPVPASVAETAWTLGIPVHEGYGLSECCSVVSVNRPGMRRAGTVGRPLEGLRVSVSGEGEIIVDGPSVTDGYLGGEARLGPWRTGDLGSIDDEGFLTVHGRRDNLIVTSFGRNISPEWIETMLLGDDRIALCAILGHARSGLTALIIPSRKGGPWFAAAGREDVLDLIRRCCRSAPGYAIPDDYRLVSFEQGLAANLLSDNGRIRRKQAAAYALAEAEVG
ncbi:AMP-binding protein [Labrys monachus]|uniref:Long-subunit acyl-CoA synthetase (AMP-forming) n=1 Tax=Labrys monachus TaxID=217067 RepID=A0ABU0F8L6_9HYPH|nr:AMP-binding protein [Labrys monachus]MDQ0390955.1 long-subunit acyl-CoA synthetase (AMP-forming) [Labrys monachus]